MEFVVASTITCGADQRGELTNLRRSVARAALAARVRNARSEIGMARMLNEIADGFDPGRFTSMGDSTAARPIQ